MHLPDYKEARKRTKEEYNTVNYSIDDNLIDKYHNKKYFIKTYGCQMNEHDSENISAMLEELGFIKADEMKEANLVILNTCSIRENAHNKAFGMLGRLKHLKEEKKDLIVGLCGCMAQEEGVIEEILDKYKWINFVFGTHNLYDLPSILDKALVDNNLEIEVFSKDLDIVENTPVKRENNFKAYVNIIYGCNKFCTYCIVPYTRGSERSRKKEDILKEIKSLKEANYQEVTLLGQNVNAYGNDLYSDYSFGELLEDIAKIGIKRIRFVTSHPWNFTDKMIEVIAKYDNIMPSIHLPVQSGSDKVLKKMGRRYSKDEYLELFNKLKHAKKDIAISTDIIVGFPTEEEEDFKQTLELVDYCKFDNAFSFIYSKRENTIAASFEDNISLSEKEKRLQVLNDKLNGYFKSSNEKLVNKTKEVLIEGESDKKDGMYYGYTDTNKLVNVSGSNIKCGDIVKVKITAAKTWSLDGVKNE